MTQPMGEAVLRRAIFDETGKHPELAGARVVQWEGYPTLRLIVTPKQSVAVVTHEIGEPLTPLGPEAIASNAKIAIQCLLRNLPESTP